MKAVNWIPTPHPFGWAYRAFMPISAHGDPNKIGGEYTIDIYPRPPYCDRGNWEFHVMGEGDSRLDSADGFPRLFFGSDEEAKEQMQRWINKRSEIPHTNA